jgi:hypothetical protein
MEEVMWFNEVQKKRLCSGLGEEEIPIYIRKSTFDTILDLCKAQPRVEHLGSEMFYEILDRAIWL